MEPASTVLVSIFDLCGSIFDLCNRIFDLCGRNFDVLYVCCSLEIRGGGGERGGEGGEEREGRRGEGRGKVQS